MNAQQAEIFDNIDTPIGGVAMNAIASIATRIEPMLIEAIEKFPGYTFGSVLYELMRGDTQLWVIGDFQALVVTRILHRPTESVLWVEWIVGENFEEWGTDWVQVQNVFAAANGCKAVEFRGRPGWKKYEKLLPEYKPVATLYRCEL